MQERESLVVAHLHTIAARANEAQDVETLFQETLPLIVELSQSSSAWALLQAADGAFKLVASYNLPPVLADETQAALRWTPCYCQRLFLEGRLTEAVNVLQCERLHVLRADMALNDPEDTQQRTGRLVLHASVPLRGSDRVLGILNVAPEGDRPFSPETLHLLTAVGDILGAAVHRLHRESRWERALAHLEHLSQLVQRAQTTLEPEELLQHIGKTLAAEGIHCAVNLIDPEDQSLVPIYTTVSGETLQLVARLTRQTRFRLPKERYYIPELFEEGKPVVERDATAIVRRAFPQLPSLLVHRVASLLGLRSDHQVLHLPLRVGATVLGTLSLWAPSWDDVDIQVFSVLAAQIALSLHAARLHQRLLLSSKEPTPELEKPPRAPDWAEHLPVGLYRMTPEGRFTDVNRALVTMLHYPDREHLLATPASTLYLNEEDWHRRRVWLEHHGLLRHFEVPMRRHDGHVIWVRETAHAVQDAQGRTLYYEGTLEDITTVRQTEEALRRERDRLRLYVHILTQSLQSPTLEGALMQVLKRVLDFLKVPMAAIFLVEQEHLTLRVWQGLPDTLRSHLLTFPLSNVPPWLQESGAYSEPLSAHRTFPPYLKQAGVQSYVTMSIHSPHPEQDASRWLGTLWVASREENAFDADAVTTLRDLATQLGWILVHLTMVRQARERLIRLQTLREIDRAIIQQQELRDILTIVLRRIPRDLNADAAAVSLLDPTRQRTDVFLMRMPSGTLVEEEAFELADSLLHWFVERQEPVIIYDLSQDPRVQMHRDRIRNGPLVSYLGVPLIARGRTIGILHILTTRPTVFAPEDILFFRTLAGQAAIAIENARAFAEATTRARALQRMLDAQLILSTGETQQVEEILREVLHEVTAAERVGFFLYDPTTQTLSLKQAKGCPPEAERQFHPHLSFRLGEMRGLVGLVGLTRQPLYVPDCHAHPYWLPVDPSIRSAYFVPIAYGDRLFGVVSLLSTREDAFDEHDRTLADLFARHVSAALNNLHLLHETRQRARHLEALNHIIHAAATATEIPPLLEEALNQLLEALDLPIGGIWAYAHAALRRLPPEFGSAMRQITQQAQLDLERPIVVTDWERVSPDEPWHVLQIAMRRHHIRASITVPILVADLRVGGLSVAIDHPREWTPEEVALVSAVAHEIGASLERLHLFAEAKERAQRITQLAHLSQQLNQAHRLDDVIALIGQGARQLTHADGIALYVRDPSGAFHTAWHEGISTSFVTQLEHIPPEDLPGGDLARNPQPVLISDFRTLPADHPLRHLAEEEGVVSQLVWPLLYEEETIAVLGCYYRKRRTWGPLDREVIDTFARQAAIALRNAQLLEDLERTNVQLREALQAREDMLRNVTHELRTPLTMVRGYAELMEMGLVRTPAEIQEHARIILRNAQHLEHLINQMLLFQQVRHEGALPIQSLNISSWLREVVQDWQKPLADAGLRLVLDLTDDLPYVNAHPEYLRQVMDNLLDNARKFSPEGGEVRVRAWQDEQWVYVAVSDQGVGIPPDKLEHIFERFYQVDPSPTRRFGGMGLGLALAKEIITLHGGRIWAESPGEGQGATITFTLPAS